MPVTAMTFAARSSGETGTLALTEPLRMMRDSAGQRATGYPADWRPRFADAYRLELQAWIDGITAGKPSADMASAHDGLVAGAVAEAVIRSMHDGGRTVRRGADGDRHVDRSEESENPCSATPQRKEP